MLPRRKWNQYHSLFHFRDLLVCHRGVTGREIDNSVRKISDASTTTRCEIDNLDVRVYFAELLTPALHYRSGKGGTSRIQLRKLRVSRKNRSKDGRERKSDPE
jgi:hypothetical protein